MYRLLKYRHLFLCNTQTQQAFLNTNNTTNLRLQFCSLCNQAFIRSSNVQLDLIRFHSMSASSATIPTFSQPKKKSKRSRKKFTEILQVSDGISKETRATVNKLKPKQFSMLVSHAEVSDEILDSHTASLNVLDHELDEALIGESNLEEIDAQEEPEIIPQTTSVKMKTQFSKGPAYLEAELAGRCESLTSSLIAYLDVCVSCNLLSRGFSTLLGYRRRRKFDSRAGKIANVGPYNILISAYASKGNLGKVTELMDLLQENGFSPNVTTFIACFECVGRLPNDNSTRTKLQTWWSQMKEQNITENQLFQEGVFVSDQREKVLNACERIKGPDFMPNFNPPPSEYICPLLTELNTTHWGVIPSPIKGVMSKEELEKMALNQIVLEKTGSLNVKSVEKQTQPPETTLFYREKLEHTQGHWHSVVTAAFERELQVLRLQDQSYKGAKDMTLYPFFKVLPAEQYVEIIMQEIRKLAEGSETFSPSMQLLYRDIASKVLSRYQVQSKLQAGIVRKMERLYEEYCNWYAKDDAKFVNTRSKWQQLMAANLEGPVVTVENKIWPNPILLSIGKFMYNIILRDIKIDVNILRTNNQKSHCLPAFYSLYRSQGKISKEEIKPHPMLARLFRGAAQEKLVFSAQSVPMLSPPVPWSSVKHGGHIIANTEIIRLPMQAKQQWVRLQDSPPSQLYPALDALNQLGSVPWKINDCVLDVVTEVFRAGGSSELDIPEPPSACPHPDQVTPEMSKEERFQAYRRRLALRRKKAEMYSLWCDTLYRLSLANHFRKHIFWLPHNMDFRGRVYPCPPHLNHMGSDMARSILCFAKGERLGKNGLDWLKIHVVNLTGLKKRESVDERLRYAEEIMPEILDSADNPLTGDRWWVNSEEPWQTLACCMEIAKATRSPCPEEYVCHFPVHQDGSCNGLQHYAALGRDEAGAVSVNLAPASEPQDVYSCVAALVERERSKDAATGVKVAQVLDGFVKRKVIKQTVMTTVYGVTRFGARLQIARQLKDINSFPKDFVWPASTYLVGKTFESLREMFTSTKEIQDWFTESARLISGIRGQNVEWVTPLGLPIVQPYSRHKKMESSQNPRKLQVYYAMDMFERPNVMKQKNAFPPNFIHSLDSSHMMLTSLFCEQAGITFVSVHDCFWTHPSTVHIMNKVCREQFVALHQQPILENLSKSLVERYSFKSKDVGEKLSIENAKKKLNQVLTQVPPRGSFDLDQVLDSVYFFS